MSIANINGVDLNYEVAGQGQAVVFLHGMGGSTQDWTNQMAALSNKYKVVALDMRGHGKSVAPGTEAEYSVPIFCEDVFGLLNYMGIRNCCLVGHSIGGLIAIQFARNHEDRLASLVLVDVPSGPYGQAPKYTSTHRKLGELARSKGLEAVFEYEILHNPMTIKKFKKHPELKEASWRRLLMTSVDGYIFIPRAISKWQLEKSRLPEIKVPTLIYWGDEDTQWVNAAKILERGIANSVLVTVKGVGHNPHQEAPEIFNQALIKFLERVKW